MVYHARNSNRRFIEREPQRRDYDSRQQNFYGSDNYHHAPSDNRVSGRKNGRMNFNDYHLDHDDYRDDYDYRRDDYDHFPDEYDGYRRNYRPPSSDRQLRRGSVNLGPKPSIRRSDWTVRRYKKPYQSSSSQIHRSNYSNQIPPPQRKWLNDRKERRFPIAAQRYNRKRTPPPCNYIKFDNDGGGLNYHEQKMQHRRIRSYYNHGRNLRTAAPAAAADKQYSPRLPPPPPLPLDSEFMDDDDDEYYCPSPANRPPQESEFMADDEYYCPSPAAPAYSSPSYSEDAARSCSPVLECSPDNTGLLEFTGGAVAAVEPSLDEEDDSHN